MSVRPLVLALVLQLAIGAGLVWAAATGFRILPFVHGAPAAQTATAPPARPAAGVPVAVAPVPVPRTDRFDAHAALRWARRQVALGPRPAGSAAQRRAAVFLRAALPHGRFSSLGGAAPGLRNIVGTLPGRGRPVVVLAHYDTTPVPGYLGANNSAAGVGAVIEIARALAREPARTGLRPVRFLLTDGEEAPTYPPSDFTRQGLRGSRVAAARPPRPSAVVVLDFIAQSGLRIPRESGSDPRLWARLRAAAARVGTLAVFPARTAGEVLDDHTPFALRGVPAIDLIDFRYACWQRPCDTMDKLSVRSVDAVGETVVALVDALRRD